MSDMAYIAERARRVFSSVAKLERDLSLTPLDQALQINLASARKLADKARNELERLAALNSVEVCQYRIVPEGEGEYALQHVSKSFLSYQNLFSQIYDSIKNGPKDNATFGADSERESTLDFAYSYSGSLGIVLLARSERDFFQGSLDAPIDALYQVLDITSIDEVRDIAHARGRAVVKRIRDWSDANAKGGFSADIRWKRSDGRQLGQMVGRRQLENIVRIIGATSEVETNEVTVRGMLVGGNLPRRTFHLVVPDGESYTGHIAGGATDAELTLGHMYEATISVAETYFYATDKRTVTNTLTKLSPLSPTFDFYANVERKTEFE